MEIRQLKAFLAIAEARTFTAAAHRIHYTQAALSMQIKQLEKEVGIPLFLRMPRRVVLTEAGERLIERAHPELDRALRAVVVEPDHAGVAAPSALARRVDRGPQVEAKRWMDQLEHLARRFAA